MAQDQENRSKEDLTEEASPHRLEEYRSKGIVSQSKEISALAGLLATAFTTYALFPRSGSQMVEFAREIFKSDLSVRADLGSIHHVATALSRSIYVMAIMALPICFVGFLTGILGSYFQIGNIFSWEPLTPDFSKLNPITGLQRMLSLRQLLEGFRLTAKAAIVVLISYLIVKSIVLMSPTRLGADPVVLLMDYGKITKSIFPSLITILVLFATVDFILQRMEYNKNLRMTKQEAKQDHKEREGDPQIRARIRAVQRDLARKRMMQAVKKADVIVTNPTHIAVALVYEKSSMSAPKVVAKGADFIAQKIKQIAADAGVPLVENVPLARTLYKSVKIGQVVPRALYQAVAEVLAYVYRLKMRKM